jgi:predicted Fe-Mo cluster-binding NifX family protein
MKICIPTQDDRGLDGGAFGHFGNAPFFTLVDLDSGQLEVLINPEVHRRAADCHHADILKEHRVDAVVCSDVGRYSLSVLNDAGIAVLTSAHGRVSDIVRSVEVGEASLRPVDEQVAARRN